MRSTLISLPCVVLSVYALVGASSARAQRENLKSCHHQSYGDRVQELQLEISPSALVPREPFDATIEYLNEKIFGTPSDTKEIRWGTNSWEGRSPQIFKLGEIDLKPIIGRFSVGGPVDCEYRLINNNTECAAWYDFKAQLKLTFNVAPKNSFFRIVHSPIAQPDKQCVTSRSYEGETLAAEIRSVLATVTGLRPFAIEVSVRKGKVHLTGLVGSPAAKQLATAAASGPQKRPVVTDDLRVAEISGSALLNPASGLVVEVEVAGEPISVPLNVDWNQVMSPKGWPVNIAELQRSTRSIYIGRAHAGRAKIYGASVAEKVKLADFKSINIKATEW